MCRMAVVALVQIFYTTEGTKLIRNPNRRKWTRPRSKVIDAETTGDKESAKCPRAGEGRAAQQTISQQSFPSQAPFVEQLLAEKPTVLAEGAAGG